MKALIVHEVGGLEKLVYEDVPDPKVGPTEVLIDVRACGVNFPDSLLVAGTYQLSPPLPFSPGSEVAGVVADVGEKVTRLAVGDRVVGMGGWGGYAERVAIGQDRVLPIPEGLPFDVAAGLPTTYGTMLHAFEDRARLAEGESVLVLGAAGGIGTASIQLAKALGAGTVIAAASTTEKLAACTRLGADAVIDYATEDLKKLAKKAGGGGVDVVVDPVGGDYSEPALRAMGWGGRFLVIGFTAGDIPRIPLNLPLLKGCSIVGVFWGSFVARDPKRAAEQLARLGAWVVDGTLQPLISERVPLADGADALRTIVERRATGKIVLIP